MGDRTDFAQGELLVLTNTCGRSFSSNLKVHLPVSARVSPSFFSAGGVFLTSTASSLIKLSEKDSNNFRKVSSTFVSGTRFL